MAYHNHKSLLYVQAIWYTRHEAPWISYVDVRQVNSKKQHKKRNGSFGFIPYMGPVQTAEMMYGSFLFLLFHVLFYIYISTCKCTCDHIRMQNIHLHTCDPVQIQHVSILRWCSFEVATFLNHGRRKPIEPWLQVQDIHLYVLTSRCLKSTGVASLHQVWLCV